MAFLDNSGDIILDAVLTDLGRKRMSEGNFRITQFALGDDEIDYSLYNKNHPSGSAYYDLEILQTPILEAFATSNANINYGLVSFNGNLNLLYMPTMKVLDSKVVTKAANILQQTGSVYYVSVNSDTADALTTAFGTNGEFGEQFYQDGAASTTMLHWETGIDSTDANPPRTVDLSNQANFMESNNLIDSNFDVNVDTRFTAAIRGIDPASSVWSFASGVPVIGLQPAQSFVQPAGNGMGIRHYGTVIVPSIVSRIAVDKKGSLNHMKYTKINGPPGVVSGVLFKPNSDLIGASTQYALYGKTGQNLFGDGNTYDYIDTTVYIVGKTTGVQIQIPLRYIRKVV